MIMDLGKKVYWKRWKNDDFWCFDLEMTLTLTFLSSLLYIIWKDRISVGKSYINERQKNKIQLCICII